MLLVGLVEAADGVAEGGGVEGGRLLHVRDVHDGVGVLSVRARGAGGHGVAPSFSLRSPTTWANAACGSVIFGR